MWVRFLFGLKTVVDANESQADDGCPAKSVTCIYRNKKRIADLNAKPVEEMVPGRMRAPWRLRPGQAQTPPAHAGRWLQTEMRVPERCPRQKTGGSFLKN